MSAQNGKNMDRQPLPGGSVRKARERAEARLPKDGAGDQVTLPLAPRRPAVGPTAGQSRVPRIPAPPGLQTKDGSKGATISRPTQVPQWPLQAAIAPAAGASDAEPYRPPAGSQPPQRPPRPSRVPSILDGSKIQDHTPVFQYRPQPDRDSSGQELLPVPETPTTNVSRASTQSSVGSIPDFPLPVQLPIPQPRRSVNLGPPPSARRGASSFYSNASYVSPIPEESPRSRSHASFASSAAMPESWGTPSPGPSPNYPDASYYDDIIEESSPSPGASDDADEARLVRSASVGKRAKPALVSTTASRGLEPPDGSQARPGPSPVQGYGAFQNGTGYVEGSSSSNTLPRTAAEAVTADSVLNALAAASSTDPSEADLSRATSPQPGAPGSRPYSRLSAIRRPPRLDIDAVRKAESRGSLTSLPDLIRRATRLAASLEKGRRPASRLDDLTDFPELAFGGRDGEKERSYLDAEKHQSGLSDMLAAFPPPAHANAARRSWRDSLRQQVPWPLPAAGAAREPSSLRDEFLATPPRQQPTKSGRRCCGLPIWGFILVMIIVIIVIAAAVIIPIELFVIHKQNGDGQTALQQCQAQLTCQNGGKNFVNDGFCSCICTDGFTGFDCSVSGSTGCASVAATDSSVSDATVGDAIPRLIQQAQLNFSIPLSQSSLLARFNSGNLSCTAENALVTFDGASSPASGALAAALGPSNANAGVVEIINGVAIITITIVISGPSTYTLANPAPITTTPAVQVGAGAGPGGFNTIVPAPTTFSTFFATTISFSTSFGGGGGGKTTSSPSPTSTSTVTTTMTMPSSPSAPAGSTFAVTDQVLDFARVAVLFVLQEESLDNAETAQGLLQKFFASQASSSSAQTSARSVSLGNGNTVNLLTFQVTTSNGTVGGGSTSSTAASRRRRQFDDIALLGSTHAHRD